MRNATIVMGLMMCFLTATVAHAGEAAKRGPAPISTTEATQPPGLRGLGAPVPLDVTELRATARRGRIAGEVMAVIGSALSAFSIIAVPYAITGPDLTEGGCQAGTNPACDTEAGMMIAGAVAQPLGQFLTIMGVAYWVNNAKLEKRLRPRVTVIPSATGLTVQF